MRASSIASHVDLVDRAREVEYAPPGPKYESHEDDGGRATEPPIDYFELLLDPRRTALLVIDMQNIFVRPGAPLCAPDGEAIVPRINGLVRAFRALRQPVVFTAWCHRPDGSNLGRTAAYWRGIAPVDPDGDLAQIHPALDFGDEDLLVTKPKYSAFWATDLEAILTTRRVESLVLTGVATDVCVGQTLVDAFHRDYNCVAVADGTATTTPYQEQALRLHEKFWSRVMTAEEVERELLALAPRSDRLAAARDG